MPKKILFESAVHQLAQAGKRLLSNLNETNYRNDVRLFIHSWHFEHLGGRKYEISWTHPTVGSYTINFASASFYLRGDNPAAVEKQKSNNLTFTDDSTKEMNERFFDETLLTILEQAQIKETAIKEPVKVAG